MGSYFSRSFFYDYMLESGMSLTITQSIHVASFIFFHNYGFPTHMFFFDNTVYLIIFSFLLGIPGGSIYSSSLYQANAGGNL